MAAAVAVVLALIVRPWFDVPLNTFTPLSPTVRAVAGLCWVAGQAVVLISVYRDSTGRFLAKSMLMTSVAVGGATAIRFGLTSTTLHVSAVAVGLLVVLAVSLLASMIIVTAEDERARAMRLFLLLAQFGIVYQFTAAPVDGLAAIQSLAVIAAVLALSPHPSVVRRLVDRIDTVPPERLASACWTGAITLLIVNKIAVVLAGSATPQIQVGPGGVAPYFGAAGLAAMAAALESERRTNGAVLGRLTVGLLLVSALYGWLGEFGTMAVSIVAVLIVSAMLAPLPVFAALSGMAMSGAAIVRTPGVVEIINAYQPRVGGRLLAWIAADAAPAQLQRAWEILQLSGIVGHAGAARVRLVVGNEATRDYAVYVVASQGGWASLAMVVILIACFLKELIPGPLFADSPFRRAAIAGLFAVVASTFLLTLLATANATPFIGFPAAPLSRGGSHAFLLALALVLITPLRTKQPDYDHA